MSVCLIVSSSRDLHLLALAAQFAEANDTELLVLEPIRRRGERALVDAESEEPLAKVDRESVDLAMDEFRRQRAACSPVAEEQATSATDEPRRPACQLRRLYDERLDEAVLEEIEKLGVTLLLVPSHHTVKGGGQKTSLELKLFARAPCEVIYLSVPDEPLEFCRRILVSVNGEHSQVVLQRAESVARRYQGEVTALYVEAEVDEVSELVGLRKLDRLLQRALGGRREFVTPRVALAPQLRAGLRQAVEPSHQLLLLGAAHRGKPHRLLFGTLGKQESGPAPVVGVVRAAAPVASRLWRSLQGFLQDRVPQLGREERVSLVERVQSSSQWDFDFTVLICLSTLIAALGLLLDSAAVVIGAMLVAPLMTPLVGGGLALVQGNQFLAKTAAWSVLRGFLLAFAIAIALAFLMGVMVGDVQPTSGMETRTAPNAIDLIVAYVSGLAAAYAMGRPNLVSALPGVAIAAALVPPVATAGMCLALSRWSMAGGALLLFLTNIVAIVLGTATTLWAVGIRDTHKHGAAQRWSKRIVVILALLLIVLAVDLSWPRVPRALKDDLTAAAARNGARVRSIRRQPHSAPTRFIVDLESARSDHSQLAAQLHRVAESHFGAAEVELRVRLVKRARD